jgi:hypothetical protein
MERWVQSSKNHESKDVQIIGVWQLNHSGLNRVVKNETVKES